VSEDGGSRRWSPGTTLLVVALALTIIIVIVGVVLALHGGLPSGADCNANPNLIGC
jgi:hypothetical protein